MKRLRYFVSAATVALGLALAPASFAAGHGGGGFGGHVGGFGGHAGSLDGHIGGFGGEHALGSENAMVGAHSLGDQALGGHSFDSGHLTSGGRLADRGHDLGGGIFLGDTDIAGSHLMYGRVPRFGRSGVFLGYYYPNPGLCYQYPEYYNPAAGCYGLSPVG